MNQEPKLYRTLAELSEGERRELLDYVIDNFRAIENINHRHTAYGLKQRFGREHFFVTQELFTEAMRTAGYGVEQLPNGSAYFAISENSPFFRS